MVSFILFGVAAAFAGGADPVSAPVPNESAHRKEIETWREFRRLFELAHLVIVNRPGFPFREDVAPFQILNPNEPVDLPGKNCVFYLPFVEQPISSTEIRDERKRGEDVRQHLPPQVWSYIEKNNLYCAEDRKT